jgi:hypothetical protein
MSTWLGVYVSRTPGGEVGSESTVYLSFDTEVQPDCCLFRVPPPDPTAVAIIDTLQSVCIPAVEGGNLDRLARSNGYHKSSDIYVVKGRGFQLTLYPSGSNPTQCHLDIVSPVYPEAPAAAIVVALHNWAAVERGWTLYRNDKSVDSGQQLTTRSWEHDDPGKHEAMFITTYRRPDGEPMKGSADTSTLVYSETPAS